MKEKKQDATEYSKDAFFHNPPASDTDRTGYSRMAEADAGTAQNLADLMNATVKQQDPE